MVPRLRKMLLKSVQVLFTTSSLALLLDDIEGKRLLLICSLHARKSLKASFPLLHFLCIDR
jgi:hypothetical protein